MEKLTFNTLIKAPRKTVWNILWSNETYPVWTSAFCEGSHALTDWQQGSKVLFLDGKGSGMVSTVAERREPEYMSFEHLGEVKDGVEDTESDKVKQWAGAHENYTLNEANGQTELVVEMDSDANFKDYFLKTWPPAMDKIKELAEAK
ncbi:SRPBCC domain-containing protein [Mucilaginibacter sp. PAMB04274]|uniref:SRPBCC domain-containing protein n=1 Tax=Mucilaginibacter sp. PAMB04274 TaxID=3138568 RepID=UPI0031F6209B